MSEAFQEAMKEGKIKDLSRKKKLNNYDKALTPSNELNEIHLNDWLGSGIPAEVIHEIGVKTSLSSDSWNVQIWDIKKEKLLGVRTRYNKEAIEANKYPSSEGSTPKYRPSEGLGNVFFYPHVNSLNWSEIAKDTSVRIFITEGEKKATKLTIEGYPCIGLFGVHCWLKKNESGESAPVDDFQDFKWRNRKVYIVFDSDKFSNKAVLEAEGNLWNHLKELGAEPFVINLPYDKDTKGVDDFFVKHGGSNE